ncbi:hypothetical protein KSP40_PGU010712 [Platanthera guangdongensis]|uniref:Ubiquitin-like-conjugating enzyme ATG10 n=1 Tax=Platanthera guangdongensis TaxID=2320717 RepID=A0ABR2MFQ8_9ASPA
MNRFTSTTTNEISGRVIVRFASRIARTLLIRRERNKVPSPVSPESWWCLIVNTQKIISRRGLLVVKEMTILSLGHTVMLGGRGEDLGPDAVKMTRNTGHHHSDPNSLLLCSLSSKVQVPSNVIHAYDFHIAYSHSYRDPVLYFNGHRSDGQPLDLDEIQKDLPEYSRKLLTESKWTFITVEEHPYLHQPWYMLHPCGTSDWMKLLLHGRPDAADYLISWLSVVGQIVGLRVPISLVSSCLTEKLDIWWSVNSNQMFSITIFLCLLISPY